MTAPATRSQEAGLAAVHATLNYLVDTGTKPVTHIVDEGTGPNRREEMLDARTVPVHDARPIAGRLSLDVNGFALVCHDSAVTDFLDRGQVDGTWTREVEALVANATGASRVLVFDHTLRIEDEAIRTAKHTREPVRVVHNDYTEKSGPQRVRDLLPRDEAEAALAKRYVYVNVWRTIAGPVEEAPLAICDWTSLTEADMVATDLKYRDRVGEIYRTAWRPNHRWYYFPYMTPGEVLLLKCFDTERDGRARWTAHTAFDDPTTPAGAAPRQSIETRTIAFFDTDG